MALRLSPESWIAGLVKLSTGRVISAKFKRILTIILVPVWLLSLAQIIMSLLDIKREVNEYNKNPHVYPEHIFKHNLREPIEIIIYMIVLIVVPWLLLRLVFWVIDAEKVKESSKQNH